MYSVRLLIVSLPLLLASTAMTDVASKDYIEVPWQATSHTAALPAPFNSVTVNLHEESASSQELAIEVNGQSVTIDQAQLVDFKPMRVESLSYSDPATTASKTVEYFEVFIVFGKPYKVGFEPCDDLQNFGWEEDVAVFRIDKTLTASMRITSFRSLDQCSD